MRPLLLVVALLAFPASASATTYKLLHKHHSRVRRIGPLEVYGGHGTLNAAKAAFGAPSSKQNIGPGECQETWSTIGLILTFESGHPTSNTCHAHAIVVSFTASGSQFTTHKGIHPGSTEDQLHQKYPNVMDQGAGVYNLETAFIQGIKTTVITAFVGLDASNPGGPHVVNTLSGSAAEATSL